MLRSIATVGGSTLVSRVLGFIRDVMMATYLGSGPVADAFFVAFRLPNLFRRWFAEGAFNSAFVPLFARRLEEEGEASAKRFAEETLSGLGFTLLAFTALAEIAMSVIMIAFAPGFLSDPEKFDLAVVLTRITFPYLLCMSVIALLSGLLNATGRFAVAAAAPILLNVVLISVLVAIGLAGHAGTPMAGIWLAWGVFAAGFVQLGALVWAAAGAGYMLRIRRPRLTPGVKRLIALGIPGVVAGGVTQINIFVGTIIASLKAGAVSFLYYADRLYQLPLGVIGIAIGVVLLPDLARRLRAGDGDKALDSQNRALEYSMLLTLPAAVALAVVPQPIISVLFEHGKFTADDRVATAGALAFFALGLPGFVLIKVFSPGYFAREDTKTPMIFAAVGVAVNIVGSLVLFPFLAHVGIAIATSLSGWANTGLLWATLAKRGHFTFDAGLRRRLPMMLVSSVVMGVALYALQPAVAPFIGPDRPILLRVAVLAVFVLAGVAVYFGTAQLTGATDLKRDVGQILRRRRRRVTG
ncbi:MAG: murein biosynthesis integral membrane protein MurJ [Rhodobiaceae bacterium]|nr:murein biosynthesis integral membrane protein MurJ [Rhodobiaceae bacterium]